MIETCAPCPLPDSESLALHRVRHSLPTYGINKLEHKSTMTNKGIAWESAVVAKG